MSLLDCVMSKMTSNLFLRMEITPFRLALDEVDAELISYWENDDGPVVLHITFLLRNGSAEKMQFVVNTLTTAFMMSNREAELREVLPPILERWEDRGWGTQVPQMIRLGEDSSWHSRGEDAKPRWRPLAPEHWLALQHLARLHGVVELANQRDNTDQRFSLQEASRRLRAMITQGNTQLARLTG